LSFSYKHICQYYNRDTRNIGGYSIFKIKFKNLIWIWDYSFKLTLKYKAIPVDAWTGPEGPRRFRPPYFKTGT
jgi:hypothetical protein